MTFTVAFYTSFKTKTLIGVAWSSAGFARTFFKPLTTKFRRFDQSFFQCNYFLFGNGNFSGCLIIIISFFENHLFKISMDMCIISKRNGYCVSKDRMHCRSKMCCRKNFPIYTKQKLKPLFLSQNIAIKVPKFDRRPLDPKNILGVIVDIKNNVYQIGTKHGILNR